MAPYEQASYAEILRWLEDTEIQYTPNGKRPGTKSAERYDKYSQAKTVAEALQLGSKPLDLVNDYAKKILRRTGGPYRDAPLNLAQVQDPSTLSKTDQLLAPFAQHLGEEARDALKRARAAQADRPKAESSATASGKAMLSRIIGLRAGGSAAGAARPAGGLLRPKKKLHLTGLLGRVQAKAQAADALAAEAASGAPPTAAAPAEAAPPAGPGAARPPAVKLFRRGPKKVLQMGGLLARVQQKATQGPIVDNVEAEAEAEASTPPSKRLRFEDEAEGSMAGLVQTGRKVAAPTSTGGLPSEATKMLAEEPEVAKAADEVVQQLPAAPPLPSDPTCHHFLRLASVLAAEGASERASEAIGEHLRAIARSVGNPEAMLQASFFLLDPPTALPDEVLASALAKLGGEQPGEAAGGLPTLSGEALAAKALAGFRGPGADHDEALPSPLTIEDVACEVRPAAAEAAEPTTQDAAASRVAALVGRAQTGMEAFYLVRLLQGKLAPSRDIFQLAVGRALVR